MRTLPPLARASARQIVFELCIRHDFTQYYSNITSPFPCVDVSIVVPPNRRARHYTKSDTNFISTFCNLQRGYVHSFKRKAIVTLVHHKY